MEKDKRKAGTKIMLSKKNKNTSQVWSVLTILFLAVWPLGVVVYKFLERKEKKTLLETQKPLAIIGWIYIMMALFCGATDGSFWIVLIPLIIGYRTIGKSGKIEEQMKGNYGKVSYTGYLWVGGGVLVWLIALFGRGDEVSMAEKMLLFYFMAGGLVMLFLERTAKEKAGRFQQYLQFVLQQRITSIVDLSLLFQNNPVDVVRDLEEMIKAGYFGNAYIDQVNQEIVFPHRQKAQKGQNVRVVQMNAQQQAMFNQAFDQFGKQMKAAFGGQPTGNVNQTANQPQQPRTMVVTCKNCGANNTITTGQANVCEFCGSPIGEN